MTEPRRGRGDGGDGHGAEGGGGEKSKQRHWQRGRSPPRAPLSSSSSASAREGDNYTNHYGCNNKVENKFKMGHTIVTISILKKNKRVFGWT